MCGDVITILVKSVVGSWCVGGVLYGEWTLGYTSMMCTGGICRWHLCRQHSCHGRPNDLSWAQYHGQPGPGLRARATGRQRHKDRHSLWWIRRSLELSNLDHVAQRHARRPQHFQFGSCTGNSTAQATERYGSCRRLDCMVLTPDAVLWTTIFNQLPRNKPFSSVQFRIRC